jgi:hypothetical protein
MSDQASAFQEIDERPRSLCDAAVRKRRKAMLRLPHAAPLADYAAKLRDRGAVEAPDFDPLDGGADAQVLFLFEKPGPMTAEIGKRVGSGFISRNNDDATAEATFRFMEQAGIPRKLTVIWNVIPWWNGTRHVTAPERGEGLACLEELLERLPALAAVMLVGEEAGRAKGYFDTTELTTFNSSHPSPLVRARYRVRWEAIPSRWAEVMPVIRSIP